MSIDLQIIKKFNNDIILILKKDTVENRFTAKLKNNVYSFHSFNFTNNIDNNESLVFLKENGIIEQIDVKFVEKHKGVNNDTLNDIYLFHFKLTSEVLLELL